MLHFHCADVDLLFSKRLSISLWNRHQLGRKTEGAHYLHSFIVVSRRSQNESTFELRVARRPPCGLKTIPVTIYFALGQPRRSNTKLIETYLTRIAHTPVSSTAFATFAHPKTIYDSRSRWAPTGHHNWLRKSYRCSQVEFSWLERILRAVLWSECSILEAMGNLAPWYPRFSFHP